MRKFVAFLLDVIISFGLVGYVIGILSGQVTENGFELSGVPALILFAEIILYFTVLRKKLGKTPGQILLKV